MVLRVGPWLVDVGFGDHSHHPLRWDHEDRPGGTRRARFRWYGPKRADLDVWRERCTPVPDVDAPAATTRLPAGCCGTGPRPTPTSLVSLVCSLTTVERGGSVSWPAPHPYGGRDPPRAGAHDVTAEVLDAYRRYLSASTWTTFRSCGDGHDQMGRADGWAGCHGRSRATSPHGGLVFGRSRRRTGGPTWVPRRPSRNPTIAWRA
jgi:hypothetical protein